VIVLPWSSFWSRETTCWLIYNELTNKDEWINRKQSAFEFSVCAGD
jgi:hypothetical protein